MIEKCNLRTVGISGLEEQKHKMYCGICTFDTALSKDGKTIDRFSKINPLCSEEENCILYQTYKKLFEPKHKCIWNTIGCQLYDHPHTPEECIV